MKKSLKSLTQQYQQIRSYGKIIGIDLGTTNSCVSYLDGQDPKIIPNAVGKRTTPSMIGWDKTGKRLIGEPAKRQSETNSETLFKVKRLIGRKFTDQSVQEEKKVTPYKIVSGKNGAAYVEAHGKQYSPAEVASMILTEMKKTAEDYLGAGEVEGAVITCPAYFNDAQRKATRDAGVIAGLNVSRIINEPTAAALAYGSGGKDGLVAVYDLGGGTFDISILEIKDGVFSVKATNGDTHLGGEDFDNVIVQHVIDTFKKEEGVDLSDNQMAVTRIRHAAEELKIALSHVKEEEINIPYICTVDGTPKHLEMSMTEEELDNMTKHMLERSIEPCRLALKDAGLKPKDINEVILVGGMTRMPLCQTMVADFFGKIPSRGVNPDEVVAMGAAIQGGIIKGEAGDIIMVDVTPLSLGTEIVGGVFSRIINKNTSIPTSNKQTYTTSQDNQTSVTVGVYQGEREIAKKNKLLGEFVLSGIPPAPKSVPQIEIEFAIDQNGIVNVRASDKATGNEQKITIQSSSGLTDAEIERMQREAEMYAEEDAKRTKAIQLKNEAETTIGLLEGYLEDESLSYTEEEKAEALKDIAGLRTAFNQEDPDEIERLHNNIRPLFARLSTEAYKNQASS